MAELLYMTLLKRSKTWNGIDTRLGCQLVGAWIGCRLIMQSYSQYPNQWCLPAIGFINVGVSITGRGYCATTIALYKATHYDAICIHRHGANACLDIEAHEPAAMLRISSCRGKGFQNIASHPASAFLHGWWHRIRAHWADSTSGLVDWFGIKLGVHVDVRQVYRLC